MSNSVPIAASVRYLGRSDRTRVSVCVGGAVVRDSFSHLLLFLCVEVYRVGEHVCTGEQSDLAS